MYLKYFEKDDTSKENLLLELKRLRLTLVREKET